MCFRPFGSSPYSPKCVEVEFSEVHIHHPAYPRSLGASQGRLAPVEPPTLSATSYGALWICTRVHGASAFRACELLVKNYGKHLANCNRSTPLSETRARNLSPPVFVVWQQYGGDHHRRPRGNSPPGVPGSEGTSLRGNRAERRP